MENQPFKFVDRTGLPEDSFRLGQPMVIPKEALDAEVERLAALPAPGNGRRVSRIINPETGPGGGLTHGIGVSLCVLKPGERTAPIRHNSSLVDFCIHGAGHTIIDGQILHYRQYDVWTTPPWAVYEHFNETGQPQVRLSYSNAPLLEKLNVHIVDESPNLEGVAEEEAHEEDVAAAPFGTFQLTPEGAFLMPYEKLINPGVVSLKPLHWPWEKVRAELDRLKTFGKEYVGRRLYLLYDPATGRTNGTTNCFFAAITIRPRNITDRPHRHASAAINYYFAGRGHSVVEGKRYTWKAGDLMLSAPGWAVHNHASEDEDVYELTIQDQPLQIAMSSLLWQETLKGPAKLLGVSGGFATNRAAVVK